MSFIIRLTSAWKVNFSAWSRSCFISATLSPSNLIASSSLGRGGGREGGGEGGGREGGREERDERGRGKWRI